MRSFNWNDSTYIGPHGALAGRGEGGEGRGMEAIQALNIALAHSQKLVPGTTTVGNAFYKDTAYSLGSGVKVGCPPPPPSCRKSNHALSTAVGSRTHTNLGSRRDSAGQGVQGSS
jgi:hypothetical protein